jgi:DNA mismatch repair protein MutL
MGRIQVLSDDVANKIAAGEVVERPASVVKELLENSLDAGATELRIEVESGGRRLIRLMDNGSGMLRDDALLAFERHATSKLRVARDLFSIQTLGFRGEALPSIASVSRLTLETRSAEEATGTRVEIAGGKIVKCDEAALAPGTILTVRDLFFNVPARKKFLRSEQTELAHIASLATHYSLAHPDKSFELLHGPAELLRVTPVDSERERVYQVFGAKLLEDLVELPAAQREMQRDDAEEPSAIFRLSGFVSRPQVQKMNRNSVFLFVNRRLIRDRLLLHALSAAYQNLIPPHAYPFALLFLDCDAEEVDVNVHPSKTEVRFRHGSFVHDFVRDVVRDTLTRSRPASSLPVMARAEQPATRLPFSDIPPQEAPWPAPPPSDVALPEFQLRPEQAAAPQRLDFGGGGISIDTAAEPLPAPPPRLKLKIPDTHGAFPEGAILDMPATMASLEDLRPLGQIHDSFIVAAGRDGLWIIDQHVAHERILFEKVLRQMEAGAVARQPLLIPLLIELSPGQQVEYTRIASDLEAIGFETEPFGPRTLAVKAAPADLNAFAIDKVLFEILEIAEGEMRQAAPMDFRRAMAASIACQAAIKINMRLDPAKVEYLIRELAATEYPMSCPHGRPVALRYAIRDILRGFHRI